MPPRKLLPVCVALAGAALSASAQTTLFDWRGVVPGVRFGTHVTSIDANLDGRADFEVSEQAGTVRTVRLLNGLDGALLRASTGGTNVAIPPMRSVAINDVNADGIKDLVGGFPIAALPSLSTANWTVASGASGATLSVASGIWPFGVYALCDAGEDLDGDGLEDALVLLQTYNLPGFPILLRAYKTVTNPPTPLFGIPTLIASTTLGNPNLATMTTPALLGDVDGDGKADVVARSDAGVVTVVRGPAMTVPVFTLVPPGPGYFGRRLSSLKGLDLDGDGRSEIGATFEPVGGPAATCVYGSATGALLRTWSSSVVPGGGGRAVALGDVDGDGVVDVGLADDATGRSVVSGATDATLVSYAPTGETGVGIYRGGDLNFDGVAEFALADPGDDLAGIDAGRVRIVTLVPVPAATAVDLGGGCGATPAPLLSATPPVMGSTFAISLTAAAPNALGFLLADFAPSVATPLGFGCVAHLDLARAAWWTTLPIVTDGAGAHGFSVPAPVLPSAAGLSFPIQAVVVGGASPFGFQLSNGVALSFGY
jgi:hypothetical protein